MQLATEAERKVIIIKFLSENNNVIIIVLSTHQEMQRKLAETKTFFREMEDNIRR